MKSRLTRLLLLLIAPALAGGPASAAALAKVAAAPSVRVTVSPSITLSGPSALTVLPSFSPLSAPSALLAPTLVPLAGLTPVAPAAAVVPQAPAQVIAAFSLKPEIKAVIEPNADATLPSSRLFDGGQFQTAPSQTVSGKTGDAESRLKPSSTPGRGWVEQIVPSRLASRFSPQSKLGRLAAKVSSTLRSWVDRALGRPSFPEGGDESRHEPNRPTVVLKGAATPAALAVLAEAGRQSAGDVYLVTDESWISGKQVAKGLTADAQGVVRLVTLTQPKVIRHEAESANVKSDAKSVYELLQAARRQVLKGKRLLVIGGAAYPEKHTIFELMHDLGVEATVVDSQTDKVKSLIKDSILVNLDDPHTAIPQADAAIRAYIKEHGAFDGIVTFWEDEVPIAAELAKSLGIGRYHPLEAAAKARSKHETRKAMLAAGLPTPHFELLTSAEDLEASLKKGVTYPMILKPSFGIEAMSVVRVDSDAEARAAYAKIYTEIDPANDPIFNQGRGVVFEEYLDGEEVDVDLLMQDGRFVMPASITDNWPTQEPYFIPKGSSLPSRLPQDKQAAMIDLAQRTAQALGFTDGILHVEGKYTSRGPRLLEVNARMGGLWVRDWVKAVWGVDLAEQQLMVSAGIPIAPHKSPVPLKHLEGEFFLPPVSGTFEGLEGVDELKAMAGFYRLLVFKETGQLVLVPPQGYQRLGMLSAQGATPEEVLANFHRLAKALRIKVRPSEQK